MLAAEHVYFIRFGETAKATDAQLKEVVQCH